MKLLATRTYNINVLGRSRRLRGGLLVYSLGLVLAVLLVDSPLHTGWRALAFIPFMGGCLLMFQAAYSTCAMRAARGERETDTGVEKVVDPAQRARDRRRAAAVFSTATFFALLTTALLFLLP